MHGIYRLYENNKLIAEAPNLITNTGKDIITRYLANRSGSWAGAISVGSGTTAAVVTDTSLSFEFNKLPIYTSIPVTSATKKVVFKAVMTEGFAGYITELGLYPTLVNPLTASGDSQLLTSADVTLETWNNATEIMGAASVGGTNTNARVGVSAVQIAAGQTAFTAFAGDLSTYASNDQFRVAYYNDAAGTNFTVRFKVDASNYYSRVVTLSTANLYTFNSFAMSSVTTTGTPTWNNVRYVEIVNSSAANIVLDGVRIVPVDTFNPAYGLVSRSVLGTPVTKRVGSRYDLEYELTVNF